MIRVFRKINFSPYSDGATYKNERNFAIKGRVLKKGIHLPCRVRLFIKATGQLVQDVATDENGYYAFQMISLNRYYVVAHDPDGEYNAVIQDNIIPK